MSELRVGREVRARPEFGGPRTQLHLTHRQHQLAYVQRRVNVPAMGRVEQMAAVHVWGLRLGAGAGVEHAREVDLPVFAKEPTRFFVYIGA